MICTVFIALSTTKYKLSARQICTSLEIFSDPMFLLISSYSGQLDLLFVQNQYTKTEYIKVIIKCPIHAPRV